MNQPTIIITIILEPFSHLNDIPKDDRDNHP